MVAEKSWGSYNVIDIQKGSMTIKVSLKAGQHMSYHSHKFRDEVWTVVSGKGRTVIDGMEQNISKGDVLSISAGCRHTVEAITDLEMIEIQLGENLSVTDKIKYSL